MIIEQREEALLYLEEILFDGDNAENGPRAKLAWLIDLTSSLKELMDLGKNNSAFRDLIFTRDFAFQILDGFPSKLRRKLRKCEGEGQVLFENMVNKIEVFRENAQEEVNKLDEALYDLSAKDATKVDVFKLSEHQIEKIMKDKVSLDDTRAYKAVIVDEYGQLDDLKGAIADVNSLDEPQGDFNARISINKKIEHNPGEECKDHKEWELEENAEAFEDMHGSLADKFNVNEEAGYNNDVTVINDKELDDKTTKDIGKDDVDLNHSKVAKNLEVKVNLNDANALKAVVNVDKKSLDDSEASIAEVNAYEDSTATVFLPRIDLNANFVKKEVEHCSDETSENFDGRSNDICDEVKLETENMKESEYSAIDSSFERDFADDGPNINGDQKKEVVVVVTENDKEDVTAEESFVMKTVRIFKNKKYLRSETYRIKGNNLMSCYVKEISSEDQMNDDHTITENDASEYVDVHGKVLNASDRELLVHVERDSKEEVLDDDNNTAEDVDDNVYSEDTFERQRMFSEGESRAARLLFGGSLVENSAEKLKHLDIVPDADVTTKEEIELELYESSPKNHIENHDINKNTLDENVKGENQNSTASKDEDILNISEDSIILEETKMEDSPEVIKVLFKGTFLENSEEIHTNLKKFVEVIVKEVISNDAYVHSTLEDLDNEKVILIEEVNGDQAEKSEVIKLMFEGTYLENCEEILDNLNKCNKKDFENNEANEVEVNISPLENQPWVENYALETVPEILDEKGDLLQLGGKAVDEANDPGNNGLNNEVLNLTLLAILEFVGNILSNMLMCMVQCVHLSPVLALLSMFLKYDTEPVEKVTKEVNEDKEGKYMMTGLDVRLKAVGGHEVGVQHSVKAKMTKLKMIKRCMNCCCYPHSILNTVDTLGIDVELSKEFTPDLLDRAWNEFEDYKVQMLDGMHVVQDNLAYLLRAINTTDLGQAELDDEEDDQFSFFASANTSEAMPSTQSGLRAGMGYCFMLVGALLQVSVSRTDNSAYPS